jgi:site-specific DNA-methyltransferase (adenine-specific)/adenine-specific DNA-methyltransferase
MDIEIGDETFHKEPNILEEIAYRDTWGRGADSFIAMIYERLTLMRDLLAEDGSIYVHCDWRVSGHIRSVLDEVFGATNFVNEVIWWYEGPQSPSPLKFGSKHDTIFRYAKNINRNKVSELMFFEEEPFDPTKYSKDSDGRYFYTIPKGDYTEVSIKRLDSEGKIYWTNKGTPRIKKFLEVSTDGKKLLKPKKIPDVW